MRPRDEAALLVVWPAGQTAVREERPEAHSPRQPVAGVVGRE
jgi:hypothetical protein